MAFSVETADIPKLDYDFRPLYSAYGASPEPAPEAVRKFQMKIKDTASILGRSDLDVNDPKAMGKFIQNLTEDQLAEVDEKLFEHLAELLQNRPSKEDMMGLYNASYRYGQEYIRQTVEDVLDPKRENRDI